MLVEERRLSGMLRRLADDEKPLQVCLRWSDNGGADSLERRQFVLQNNVTSDIAVRTLHTQQLVITTDVSLLASRILEDRWHGLGLGHQVLGLDKQVLDNTHTQDRFTALCPGLPG